MHVIRRALCGVAVLSVVVVALAARIQPYGKLVSARGVDLGPDTDPHYHVIRAERILNGPPGATWFDGNLSYPNGAEIPWPPLYDGLVAWLSRTLHPHPTRVDIEFVASWLPPILGSAATLLVMVLTRQIGSWTAVFWAGLSFALAPAAISISRFGRADHHAAEQVLFAAAIACLSYGRGSRRVALWWPVLSGLIVAAAFWCWQGAPLFLAVFGFMAACVHIFADDNASASRFERSVAISAWTCAVAVAIGLALWGNTGTAAATGLHGIAAPAVGCSAALGAWASILAVLRAKFPQWRSRRVIEVAVLSLAGVLALMWPAGSRATVLHGLSFMAARNPWHASIGELTSVVAIGPGPVSHTIARAVISVGLWLLVVAAAVPSLRRACTATQRETWLVHNGAACALVTTAALTSIRFTTYTVPLFAVAAGILIADASTRRRRIAGLVCGFALLIPSAILLRAPLLTVPGVTPAVRDALEFMRTQPRRSDAAAVLASWEFGHAIQYFSDRPVIATPFGADVTGNGFEDWARWLYEEDEEASLRFLDRRRVQYVMSDEPSSDQAAYARYAPDATPLAARATYIPTIGRVIRPGPRYWDTIAARLYHEDGCPRSESRPAIARLRLIYETPAAAARTAPDAKLFEVVHGARLQVHARECSAVHVSVRITTNQGRRFTWRTTCSPAGEGQCSASIPYSTGMNGAVSAEPLVIDISGSGATTVTVSEAAIESGDAITVPAT